MQIVDCFETFISNHLSQAMHDKVMLAHILFPEMNYQLPPH